MTPNPVLKKLGFSENDRVVIIHADDIGNFQSSLAAYREIFDAGLVSSAATMVPCSWFPATAEFCRANAGHPNLDMGVHLTLTSEWPGYRWGPVASCAPQLGLVDGEGYFHSTSAAVQQQADRAAVHAELKAQVERALAAGIDITHVDSHMLALYHPRLVDIYVDLALAFKVPPFLLRQPVPEFNRYSVAREMEAQILAHAPEWEARGIPLLDSATMMPLDNAADRAGQLLRKLDALKPGITYLLLHPTKESAELCEAVPDRDWPCRVADYETFQDTAVRDAAYKTGVHIIGYRALRDLMREAL